MAKHILNKNLEGKKLKVLGVKKSLYSGLISFLIIFSVTSLIKLIPVAINNTPFEINVFDFSISFWGFTIFSFVTFVNENNLGRS